MWAGQRPNGQGRAVRLLRRSASQACTGLDPLPQESTALFGGERGLGGHLARVDARPTAGSCRPGQVSTLAPDSPPASDAVRGVLRFKPLSVLHRPMTLDAPCPQERQDVVGQIRARPQPEPRVEEELRYAAAECRMSKFKCRIRCRLWQSHSSVIRQLGFSFTHSTFVIGG